MPDAIQTVDYDELAHAELEKASGSTDPDRRRAHLNQASIFATLSEKQRRGQEVADLELSWPG